MNDKQEIKVDLSNLNDKPVDFKSLYQILVNLKLNYHYQKEKL